MFLYGNNSILYYVLYKCGRVRLAAEFILSRSTRRRQPARACCLWCRSRAPTSIRRAHASPRTGACMHMLCRRPLADDASGRQVARSGRSRGAFEGESDTSRRHGLDGGGQDWLPSGPHNGLVWRFKLRPPRRGAAAAAAGRRFKSIYNGPM
jgi:hypothetical protein